MRANRKSILSDKKGEIGIGTMIVFIASILVAAVAAAVLMDTSTKLQSKSTAAGDESVKQIASNLKVDRIVGERTDPAGKIVVLHVYLSLAPGASNVDLKTMNMQWTSLDATPSDVFLNFPYSPAGDGTDGGYYFLAAGDVRDLDHSMGATGADLADPAQPSALSPGDIVDLNLALPTLGFPTPDDVSLATRSHVTFKLTPEVGGSVIADFNVPETFGTDLWIPIR